VRNTTGRALPVEGSIDVVGPDDSTRTFPIQGSGTVAPRALGSVATSFTLDAPRLWSPESPALYDVRVRLAGQTTRAHLGFREWTRDGQGRVLLNGRPISLRGASFHEETPTRGGALGPGDIATIVRQLRASGSDFTRQHYPPSPALLEAFDRSGIVFWEQIPVWRTRGSQLRGRVRSQALSRLRQAVVRDRAHASVMTWSVGNEVLRGGPLEASYIRAAKALVRRLDPSRFVGIDKAISPASDIPDSYRELDVLGLTEYLGWYGGSTSDLRPALDRLHERFPAVGLFVTEFGAEANRAGPSGTKGTYAFQAEYLDRTLRVIDEAPYMNGALTWILRDFTVRPGWTGGNPRPSAPYNKKGLFNERGGAKPALEAFRARALATPSTRSAAP
jgi:beta-glucuronidase